MRTVKCPICGKDFQTARPNKKYCSFACKEAALLLRRVKWKQTHPDYNKEYMRQYRTARKGGK